MTRALVLATVVLGGCAPAPVGIAVPFTKVPEDGFAQCTSQCSTMGLRATAVVAMANRVGCVCEPSGSKATTPTSAAITASDLALAAEEEQQQQQQSR